MPYICIPSILKKFTAKNNRIQTEGKTIKEVLINLVEAFPALKPYLFTEAGQLSHFINIYLNSQNVGLSEEVITDKDELVILPALQGG